MYVVPAGQAARFPNDAAGFKALIAWVEVPVRAVTYEPTGRWHRAFEEALLEAGLPLVRVNPWCFRHQLLLPRPYLVLTKPLRLDIQCQRGTSVKIGWKYLDD